MSAPDAADRRIPLTLVHEGERLMRICNACRYCEGFCAVFPAMERRRAFTEADLAYLANLCHDCGECYYSCQYAPPHEFGVNLPKVFAEIRRETFRAHAWPTTMARWVTHSRSALFLAAVVLPAVFVFGLYRFAGAGLFSAHGDADGSFYHVMPHAVMVTTFGVFAMAVLLALGVGVVRFWQSLVAGAVPSATVTGFLAPAFWDTLTLRYLDGGGDGCAYPSEVPSQARRWFHHLTFYGFMLCFASTTVAAIYDNVLGWSAPYAFMSAPVILGSLGGTGLLVGPIGLLWLKGQRDRTLVDRRQMRMDVAFIVLLWLTSVTGFALLALRESAAMGTLLGVHLGIVMGLFATMPYGKFVHGLYRFAALIRYAQEGGRGTEGGKGGTGE